MKPQLALAVSLLSVSLLACGIGVAAPSLSGPPKATPVPLPTQTPVPFSIVGAVATTASNLPLVGEGDTPEKAMQEVFDGVANDDENKVLSRWCNFDRGLLAQMRKESPPVAPLPKVREKGYVLNFAVEKKIQESTTQVSMTVSADIQPITNKPPSHESSSSYLILEQGQWKLCGRYGPMPIPTATGAVETFETALMDFLQQGADENLPRLYGRLCNSVRLSADATPTARPKLRDKGVLSNFKIESQKVEAPTVASVTFSADFLPVGSNDVMHYSHKVFVLNLEDGHWKVCG